MSIISDIIVCTKAVRDARKQGASSVRIVPVKTVPVYDLRYWSWTPEALLPYPKTPGGVREAVEYAFHELDEETQHTLTFTPDPDGWTERMHLWQQALRTTATPQQYSAAILTILKWARECTQNRLGLRRGPTIVYD